MIHRYRRLWLLVGLLAAFVAAPVGARAAVEPDAVLTVTFVDAATLLPVDGADIHVEAWQAQTLIGTFDATTDANGVAVVSDVPHETGEGAEVTLDVTASKATTFTDEESGCTLSESWAATRIGVVVDGAAVEVSFSADEQTPASSLSCPPGEPEPTQQVGGAVGTPGPKHTVPPTDALAARAEGSPANAVPFALALVAVATVILLLTPRRAVARRRR